MTWRVDSGLAVLINQWKEVHPKAVVGTIAGGGHRKEGGHWPDEQNTVDAADFMPGNGVTEADLTRLVEDIIASKDGRIAYIIHGQRIISSTVRPWKWRSYTGHFHGHAHIEVNETHHDEKQPWKINGQVKGPVIKMESVIGTVPVLKQGMKDPIDKTGWYHITRMQRQLQVKDDGDYGPNTAAALKAWLKEHKIAGDGKTFDARMFKALFGIRG